jgi:hypothetical protein
MIDRTVLRVCGECANARNFIVCACILAFINRFLCTEARTLYMRLERLNVAKS